MKNNKLTLTENKEGGIEVLLNTKEKERRGAFLVNCLTALVATMEEEFGSSEESVLKDIVNASVEAGLSIAKRKE